MAYYDKHGIEYSDDKEILVKCPQSYEGDFIVPEHVPMLMPDVFVGCKKLTSVTVPKHIDYVNDHVFDGCKAISISNTPQGKKYSLTW